ncbi:MAG: SWIM zinc finger family protein [Deltaproteobacteria bacterium]|nr:SWIM zinc finger family protein [Deltaproteobacteria bacterium]
MATLTLDVIKRFAPDNKSLKSAQEVADPRKWKVLGSDPDGTLWGEYSGSSTYSIYVSASSPSSRSGCSCPSRKRPCKHVLGLMLLEVGGHPIPAKKLPDYFVDEVNSASYESTWE